MHAKTAALAGAALIAAGALAVVGMGGMNARTEAAAPCPGEAEGAAIGGPFALTDQKGVRVTSEDLKGQPLLIYFGFAYCPDICPVGLDLMSEATEILEAQGRLIAPVFITVDPERDTPAVMADFTAHFHPRMIGLTGTTDEIRDAADAYKVFYEKRRDPDFADGYTMNHTGFTYFVDAKGDFRSFFRNGATAREIAEGVQCQFAKG